ncbi:phage tail tip lysozyme [Bradyrhizobium liaoningense]|uniref:phage tail tip lysozyme n=1 Tax=Bradyrhizobium liaoningense TaxID=43992 RepID=UPI0004AC676D|nr:phage tail tip lysozyme [Bradyrhizobium liaoningense]
MVGSTAYAMAWLQKRGYLPHQAAAMVGHGMQESGLRTDATGDNGTAKGIFQWRGDRLAGLHSFAKAAGQDPNNIDTQLAYMDHELNTTERKAGDALRASTDVRGATRAGMMFERPAGYTADNPEAGHGWANRYGEASRLAGMPIDPSAAAPQTAGLNPGMLRPSVLPGPPATLAAAFLPVPPDDEIARARAVAVAQEQEQRRALLGGGIGQLFA